MPLTQNFPTPVTYPEYRYKYSFTPADVDLDGDPSDPTSPPTSFKELFADVTLNPELVENPGVGWYVKGDGILDDLMETAYKHLDAQFLSDRIRGENYAEAFVQMYLGTLQMFSQSFIQFEIAKMQARLQLALENKKMELELQIARERNESSERQATEQRDSQEKMQTEQLNVQKEMQTKDIESKEKLAANQITSQEKINAEQIKSAEKQNTDRIEAQAALIAAQVNTEIQKMNLHRRQIEAFDEDYKQKLLKINMDAWAVGYSVGKDHTNFTTFPVTMTTATINELYNSYIISDLDKNVYHRAKSTTGTAGMP